MRCFGSEIGARLDVIIVGEVSIDDEGDLNWCYFSFSDVFLLLRFTVLPHYLLNSLFVSALLKKKKWREKAAVNRVKGAGAFQIFGGNSSPLKFTFVSLHSINFSCSN